MPSDGAHGARSTRPIEPSVGRLVQTKSARAKREPASSEAPQGARACPRHKRNRGSHQRQHSQQRKQRNPFMPWLLQIRIAASTHHRQRQQPQIESARGLFARRASNPPPFASSSQPLSKPPSTQLTSSKRLTCAPIRGRARSRRQQLRPTRGDQANRQLAPTTHRTRSRSRRTTRRCRTCSRSSVQTGGADLLKRVRLLGLDATCCRKAASQGLARARTTIDEDSHERKQPRLAET